MAGISRYDAVMYVAEIPNRNSSPAILLRESFRQDGAVKNRTLANLSRWPPARIEALRRLLRGELDHLTELDPTLGPSFGLLFALKTIADLALTMSGARASACRPMASAPSRISRPRSKVT